jgi:hypothetical protein
MNCPRCDHELELTEDGLGVRAHRCCVCADAKRVRYDLPKNHRHFGVAFPCPQCAGYSLLQLKESRRAG